MNDIFAGGAENATPWNTTVQLPRFDQTTAPPGFIYVLDSAFITLHYTSTGEVDVTNNDTASSHHFTNATSSVPLTVTGPDATSINLNAVAGPISSATSTPSTVFVFPTGSRPGVYGEPVPRAGQVCVGPLGGPPCFPVASQSNYTGLTGSGSQTNSVNSLGTYQGTGSANLNYNVVAGGGTFGGTEVGGSGHLFFGGNASAGGTVAILYSYHLGTVPEPVTMMLVGSAMLGLGVAFRRKRKV